jgi:XisH protein
VSRVKRIPLAAEKAGEKIAVEVKSFVQPSALDEFHLALGQYRNYQLALLQRDPERMLYMAAPDDIYDRFLTLPFIQDALRYNNVRYFISNPPMEVIVRWHP